MQLTKNEKLTLTLSLLAFILSLLGFYFSNFYESNRLEAIVLESDPYGSKLDYKVAIINSGNQKALIKSANIVVNPNDKILSAINPFSNVKLDQELPLIIEPKSIITISFKGPYSIEQLFLLGKKPDIGSSLAEHNGEETRKVVIAVNFESMNFKGVIFHAETDIMSAYLTSTEIASSFKGSTKRKLFK